MRRSFLHTFILIFLALALLCSASAQSVGSLKGQVTDPSGAVIVSATITVKSASGQTFTAVSNAQGTYELKGLAPGLYSLTATAKGFTVYQLTDVDVPAGKVQPLDIEMGIAVEKEQVTVQDETTNVELSSANNASATVIKGKDLDALSDDPDELASDLQELAGPAAGPNGGQIYIDGFTSGQLPPKSAIREIRVNQNPFSAQFDRLGYGRVEIFTKPGMDTYHGQFSFNENNSVLNSLSPFSPVNQPDYHSEIYNGNFSGPLNKKSSFFFNVMRRNIRDVSVITAKDLVNGNYVPIAGAVPNPHYRTSISPRLDYQLTPNNTFTIRYEYEKESEDNNGIGGFSLATQGYNQAENSHNISVSDTQVISPTVINETRFQWYRDNETQYAPTLGPTIAVQGAFTSGGSSVGTVSDLENRYEFQNYTSMALGKHFVKFGARIRANRTTDISTSGFNGTYTFNTLEQYYAGIPSQFSITRLGPNASPGIDVFWMDAGLYAEDDWKIRPNFTLSYGLRFETQNDINDHADFAPRVGIAWGLGSSKGTPKTVLRAGFGMFYDRFNDNLVMNTIRNNGVNYQRFILSSDNGAITIPYCVPITPTCPAVGGGANTPTINVIDPKLQSPYMMQTAVTLERQVAKTATASVTYINSRGVHTFNSQNVNYPIDGVFPLYAQYGKGNVYQYQSQGIFRQNQLIANTNIRMGAKFTLFSFYSLNYANSDTSGAGSFPSQPYNLIADYGRATFDIRHRFMVGGNFNLPYRFSLSPFIMAHSGFPFNFTAGKDVNNDSIFNDRPTFAGPGSTDTVTTPWGVFDRTPVAGHPLVPINYGTGPSGFTVNLRVSKTFGFGKEAGAGSGASQGGGDHGHGPGGHGPGRGGPPRGMGPGGPGGPFGGGPAVSKRYNLTFSAAARNLFNRVNLAAPIGNLSSPDFGQSIALAGGPFGSSSSNRRIDLQVQFSF